MNPVHPMITSPTFSLVKTIEFDLDLSSQTDSDAFSLRVELFQSLSDSEVFRYKVWRTELFRIQSEFPRGADDTPKHEASVENILVEFGVKHFGNVDKFSAKSMDLAIKKIVEDLNKALEHISGEEIKNLEP